VRNGVRDTDREQSLIQSSPDSMLDIARRQIEAAIPLVREAASPIAGALKFVGVEPNDPRLKDLEPEFEDTPPGTPPGAPPGTTPPEGGNGG